MRRHIPKSRAARAGVWSAAAAAGFLFLLAVTSLAAAAIELAWAAGPSGAAGEIIPAHEEITAESDPAGSAYQLHLAAATLRPGREQHLAFRVLAPGGRTLTDFEVTHERRMHVILLRRDLTGFQHLHPQIRSDGTWVTKVAPLEPGSYRVFADFASAGAQVLSADTVVPGESPMVAIGPATTVAPAGPYRVVLAPQHLRAGRAAELRFDVLHDGRAVAVGRYLGARGHLVVVRAGDLAYLHTHADASRLAFHTSFPSAGRYRAFLQFSVGGAVRTAAFTLDVGR